MNLIRNDNRDVLFAVVVDHITQTLLQAIEIDGHASLALSGGSTPAPVYALLDQQVLPWNKIQIAMVDERWVDNSHPRSNEAMLRDSFSNALAAGVEFIGMKNQADNALKGMAELNRTYQTLKRPFDCIVLGLGTDGHFASLFPHSLGLGMAFDPEYSLPCVAIKAQQSAITGEETDRASLTATEIARSASVLLLITGDEKLQTLNQARAGADIPLTRLLQLVDLNVYWAP